MRIEKMPYSAHPWRLLTDEGQEVMVPQSFDHPALGKTAVMMPVSGATKKECTDQALALLGWLWRRKCKQPLTFPVTVL